MTHRHAPLTPLGRQRAVAQVLEHGRPVAHVAAEFRISRWTLSTWVTRYRAAGPAALGNRSSAPARRPTQPPVEVVELIESWRREKKWCARRIAREPLRIIARYPGHMVHMDVKKVGKLRDGGGWWADGRGSAQDKKKHAQRIGDTYLHAMAYGFSRLAYTEALEDEKAVTTIGFFHRARVFFAEHGITRFSRQVIDNGVNDAVTVFARLTCAFIGRHQRTRVYVPRHNGKIERYQRILAEECVYARPYDSETERRNAIGIWVHHDNCRRPRTAPPAATSPLASRLHADVDNVVTTCT